LLIWFGYEPARAAYTIDFAFLTVSGAYFRNIELSFRRRGDEILPMISAGRSLAVEITAAGRTGPPMVAT
jgi:hypothetical protein